MGNCGNSFMSFGLTPVFQDDYTTNTGWTQSGSGVTVDSGVADAVAGVGSSMNAGNNVRKDISLSLSATLWYADFVLTPVDIAGWTNDYDCAPMFLSDVDSATLALANSTHYGIGMDMYELSDAGKCRAVGKDAANAPVYSTEISVVTNTLYYIRLQRTSATNITLNIFSDAARTSHITGSPQSVTIASSITGSRYLYHSSTIGSTAARSGSWTLDTIKIYNNVSSP